MDDQNKNLILATALSFLVILAWFFFFPPPEPEAPPQPAAVTATDAPAVAPPAATDATGAAQTAEAAPEAPRVAIDTPRIEGSITLLGGRIDDLKLKDYQVTLDPKSDLVRLLTPVGQTGSYYALYGWAPGGDLGFEDVPGPNTEWTVADGTTLSLEAPVTLRWDNGKGLIFSRTLSIDENYMFTVTQAVENTGATDVSVAPYGIVARHGMPADLQNFFVLHEGVVGRVDGTLTETKYKALTELPVIDREGAQAEIAEATKDGWIGFTDKYWMTTLIPEQGKPFTAVTKYVAATDVFQVETRQPVITVAAGTVASSTSRLFAGAKEWETIRAYQNEGGIAGFVDSIDWGWFYFLTKPFFFLLDWIKGIVGNFGLAILIATVLVKAAVFPLANKSYASMSKMKKLQPEMERLKKEYPEDKMKQQQEMMALYKREKVSPLSGCLPVVVQIPIFFSLYKVILTSIELRHAPFFGWIHDLSAPDPTSLFNLFGLIPWTPPHMLMIGVWPIIMGITMWLQMRLNPAPPDPVQASLFNWMPVLFTFMLGTFPVGLVIYWAWSNTLSVIQQSFIMKKHGVDVDLLGNVRNSLPFLKKKATS